MFILFFASDVLPSAAVEKTGTMLSDGAIYSSIDFMGKAGYSSPARGTQPTPYATTQILQSNSFHELAVDRPDPRWKASLQAQQEIANLGYSLTDRRPGSGMSHDEMIKIFVYLIVFGFVLGFFHFMINSLGLCELSVASLQQNHKHFFPLSFKLLGAKPRKDQTRKERICLHIH